MDSSKINFPVVRVVLIISAFLFYLIINLPESTLVWLGGVVECSGEVSGLKRTVCHDGEPWVKVFFLFSPLFFVIGFSLFFIRLHFYNYSDFQKRRMVLMLNGGWKKMMFSNVLLLFGYWYVVGYMNTNFGFDVFGFSLIKNKVIFFLVYGAWHLVFMPMQVVLVTLEIRLFFNRGAL